MIQSWFDLSKAIVSDFCRQASRHHAEGITLCEHVLGIPITLSTGKVILTRWVGQQLVREDLGHIPSFADGRAQSSRKRGCDAGR